MPADDRRLPRRSQFPARPSARPSALAPALLLALVGLVGVPAGDTRAASPSSPTPAPATNVQIDWEHCLLSVLHRYKKAGPEPTSPAAFDAALRPVEGAIRCGCEIK